MATKYWTSKVILSDIGQKWRQSLLRLASDKNLDKL